MKFQIKNIIVWPKDNNFAPRILNFELGRVNIITGDSRTGKSAIIHIIDYCLGSKDCFIPIEIIRDYASWYGLLIVTNNEEILIARSAPDKGKASTAIYFCRGQKIEIPKQIAKPNQTVDGLKILLNDIAQIPYLNRDSDENGYDNTISFRDVSHLCFQSQDIVANQAVLFYKTHLTEHREKIKTWFPYILGAETKEVIEAREKRKFVQNELNNKEREYKSGKELSQLWLRRFLGTLQKSKFYGLYEEDIIENLSQEELLDIAKSIVDRKYRDSNSGVIDLDKEIKDCEDKLNSLYKDRFVISKRIQSIKKIKETLIDYDKFTKRKIERLGISDWFKTNKRESNICPFCGSSKHDNANREIEKISNAVEKYEDLCSRSVEFPAALQREFSYLQKELEKIKQRIEAIEEQKNALKIKDEEQKSYTEKRDGRLKYIGNLEYMIQAIEKLTDTGDLRQRINELKEVIKACNAVIKNNGNKLSYFLEIIAEKMLKCLKGLDVESIYQKVRPEFSIKEMSIKVKDASGVDYMMSEIGSASNWVSFHIALTCSIQEFLNAPGTEHSCVPSFEVYDQPSQVYFPRTGKKDNQTLTDNDKIAVRKIFTTLSNSIERANGAWQAIVLEHADDGVYNGIPLVHEVEIWRHGNKLIPEEWINQGEN